MYLIFIINFTEEKSLLRKSGILLIHE